MTALSTYNIDHLIELAGDDTTFVKTMLEAVLDTFPEELNRLREAFEKKDREELRATAHKIRPTLISLNMNAITAVKEIETWSDNENFDDLHPKVKHVIDEIEKALTDIRNDYFECRS